MSKRNDQRRRTNRNKLFIAVGAILLSLLAFVFVYYAYDEFAMYWFLLVNQDGVSERRRSEDFSWYSGSGGYYEGGNVKPGTSGSSDPGWSGDYVTDPDGLFSPTYQNMEPYQALKAIEGKLTDEETQDPETFFRFLIYYMDQKKYVPNAIIAVIANSEGECSSVTGGILCTWLYQGGHSGGTVSGPDGVQHSTLKDNDAWAKWVEDRGALKKGTGLGFYQWSNGRALNLIEYANTQGTIWQSPSLQISFFFEVENQETRWNISNNLMPGVDPKSSVDVSVSEWVYRLFADEMSGGTKKYTSFDMTSDHGHNETKRIGAIEAATEIYNKWSRKDPWFYTQNSNPTTRPTYTGDNDWHNPFIGPTYDNSTPQGLLIARIALLLSAWDYDQVGSKPKWTQHGYNSKDLTPEANPTLQYYREANMAVLGATNNGYWASCDAAASTAVLLSGVDDEFVHMSTSAIKRDLKTRGVDSGKWIYVGEWSEKENITHASLQPGDVIVANGHIKIWVGPSVSAERYADSTANVYQASKENYYPIMRKEAYGCDWGDGRVYDIYRCVNPSWSSVNWDKFIARLDELGGKFPELPRIYNAG